MVCGVALTEVQRALIQRVIASGRGAHARFFAGLRKSRTSNAFDNGLRLFGIVKLNGHIQVELQGRGAKDVALRLAGGDDPLE